jgi:hypothetical protein
MTELARRAFSGCRDQVRLRAGCECFDSGDGGKFEVIVQRSASLARVSVCDQGSTGTPNARPLDLESESGRGLGLVAMIADDWGQSGDGEGRAVWFELGWEPLPGSA